MIETLPAQPWGGEYWWSTYVLIVLFTAFVYVVTWIYDQ